MPTSIAATDATWALHDATDLVVFFAWSLSVGATAECKHRELQIGYILQHLTTLC